MQFAAVHPGLWTRSNAEPSETQVRVSEVIEALRVSGLRPAVTQQLQRLLCTEDGVVGLCGRIRDPNLIAAGVVPDLLIGALFNLAATATFPTDHECAALTTTDESADLGSIEDPIRAAFMDLLLSGAHQGNASLSEAVLAAPNSESIQFRVLDSLCHCGWSGQLQVVYAGAPTMDDWMRGNLGWFERPEANVLAALVGREIAAEWRIAATFAPSFSGLPDLRESRIRSAYRACAVAITRDTEELARHGDEPLRGVRRRQMDNAQARRLRIANNTPQAPRLHYWYRPGYVELAKVGRHDDVSI